MAPRSRAGRDQSVATGGELTVVAKKSEQTAVARPAPTQDECVALAEQVAAGSFHRLPVLAQALVHHLCEGIPADASVHEATAHIALRGVGVLQRLPLETAPKEAVVTGPRRYLVLLGALCGAGIAMGVASTSTALVLVARWAGMRGGEMRALSLCTFAWLAWCGWSAIGWRRADVLLGLAGLAMVPRD